MCDDSISAFGKLQEAHICSRCSNNSTHCSDMLQIVATGWWVLCLKKGHMFEVSLYL